MANIFLDETTSSFKLGPNTLADPSLQSNAFIGGTALPLEGGTVSLAFQGTSAAFYGEIGSANFSTTVAELTNLVIDDKAPTSSSIQEQGTDTLFYQTPTLSSGSHNVSFFTFSNVNFDFFVITAANDTDLSGQTLIVDDSDAALVYSGDWSKNSTVLQAATNSRTPYGGSFHQTNSVGASAVFSFTGSSVSVHGVINSGPISVTFIVDGVPVPATQFADSNGSLNPTFVWYSSDSLTPGHHTLQMKVSQASDSFFSVDYILYKPAFNSLASKPAPSQAFPGVTSSGIPASSMTGQTSSTSSQAEQTPGPNVAGKAVADSKASIAIIIGSVIGGLAFVLLLALVLWKWRRRTSKRQRVSIDIEPNTEPDPFPPFSQSYTGERKDISTSQIDQPSLSLGLTNDRTGPASSAHSSSSLLRVDPFPLPVGHRETFSPSKAPPPSSYLDVQQSQQSHPSFGHVAGYSSSDAGNDIDAINSAAENLRVRELVTELQRELEVSGDQERNELLRRLLINGASTGAGVVGGRNQQNDYSRRQSAAPSTLPPPYEAELDAHAAVARRHRRSSKRG